MAKSFTKSDFEKYFDVSLYSEDYDLDFDFSFSSWIKEVTSSHKDIRKMLGGVSNIYKVKLEEKTFNPLQHQESDAYYSINHVISSLMMKLPKYLDTYSFRREDLFLEKLPNGMKTTKHLSTYLDRNLKKIVEEPELQIYSYYTTEQKKTLIQSDISYLGQLYSDNKIAGGNYEVMINTSPEAFAKLGHYRVDHDSCFACGGSNQHCKVNLGRVKNSFILLISGDKSEIQEEAPEQSKLLARAFGFIDEENNINVSNVYSSDGSYGEDLAYGNLTTISTILEEVFSFVKNNTIKCFSDRFTIDEMEDKMREEVYLNNNPIWSFSQSDPDKV